ncbi:hypothetical protein HYFRA_00010058 [Hymenoscyphus fraxineus]|uniref:Mediator of RNA polymerase II transcription subunit 14 n=1 Tax=Hymenoscyphus fraxineus TaxID=746836 RepID=A0A9N9PHW2_9HELO|nr:hypothetical protein HYFRA_00010058 [Hymenoscyphus fraxineus]
MPGVIMENRSRNGSHTNHDRDQRPNGLNGAGYASEKVLDKGKGRAEPLQNVTPISPTIPNGINGAYLPGSRQQRGDDVILSDAQAMIDQLPPEIAHITQGYEPLSKLLSRMAQKTHNDQKRTIMELQQMPAPATGSLGATDDNSEENIKKKLKVLKFAQDAHTDWTKALVITSWSRRSDDVSKLIDLKIHLDGKKQLYEHALFELGEVKRSLMPARLPNPDLKTGLEVLTTGKAPWMPDLGYLEPPPLTAKEILKSFENLNTLLSIRMNLHEYDNLPVQFRDYTIQSGRVTFKVEGEFEVDLAIADENPEEQLWFIDFRFLFSPTVSEIPFAARSYIESRVNEALHKNGLKGCYNFLHNFVLTHQISEFKRQALALSSSKWVEGLKVEPLHRALCIQYWVGRYGPKGPKSWIILGVHSGKRKDRVPHPKDIPRLCLRWFRDQKEVKDVDFALDTVNISAESLLKTIIAKHVEHILVSTYDHMMAKPLFAKGEADLSLKISAKEPAESKLGVQLTSERTVSVRIEPVTGRFVLHPASRLVYPSEMKLNDEKDPAENAHNRIDQLRYEAIMDHIDSRGWSVGWRRTGNPSVPKDDLQKVVPKSTSQVLWYMRNGWVKNWYLAVALGPYGESWFLIETTEPMQPPPIPGTSKNTEIKSIRRIANHIAIPIRNTTPLPTYNFLNSLHIFAAALISHHANLKALHKKRAWSALQKTRKIKGPIQLPAIALRISDLIGPRKCVKDLIELRINGLQIFQPTESGLANAPPANQHSPNSVVPQGRTDENLVIVTEARIKIPLPPALKTMKEKIDRDVAFHVSTGSVSLRLRSKIGESILPTLTERTMRVFRLIEFVNVLQAHEEKLTCKNISLGRIEFTYGKSGDSLNLGESPAPYTAVIDFSGSDNKMSLILERGNPHLDIADYLNQILNGSEGLKGVSTILPLTLPVLKALDAIKATWASVPSTKGEVFVISRSVDRHHVHYDLLPIATDPNAFPRGRKVKFEVVLKHRNAEAWWYIARVQNEGAEDDIDKILKPIWNSSGTGYQGMRTSAVAQTTGVEELLDKLDKTVGQYAISQKPAPKPILPPQKMRPQMQISMPPQRVQQMVTPNSSQQSQSQNQGRMQNREVVEID